MLIELVSVCVWGGGGGEGGGGKGGGGEGGRGVGGLVYALGGYPTFEQFSKYEVRLDSTIALAQ